MSHGITLQNHNLERLNRKSGDMLTMLKEVKDDQGTMLVTLQVSLIYLLLLNFCTYNVAAEHRGQL